MALPLKLFVVIALSACCSASAARNTSRVEAQTGSSANLGKWWVRSAQSKNTAQRPAQLESEPTVADREWADEADTSTTQADRLGGLSRFGYSFAEHYTPHFHVMYRPQRLPASAVKQTGELLEHAYQKFFEEYGQAGFLLNPIEEPLSWVVFNDQEQYRDFARIADGMDTPYLESYYAARSNQVVLMQTARTSGWRYNSSVSNGKNFYEQAESGPSRSMTVSGMDPTVRELESHGDGGMLDVRRAVHEAAHQLAFNSGLQKRGVMYPLWVSEGLATNFECDAAEHIGVAGDNAPRKRQLLRAHSAGRLMPLDEFITLVHLRTGGRYSANDLYAQSWALFNFLFQTRQEELKNYLGTLAQLGAGPRDTQTMRREFIDAFGSIDRLERSWNSHLYSLSR